MNKDLSLFAPNTLTWLPELGIGYDDRIDQTIYDASYWEKYVKMANTAMGDALTAARIGFVLRHYKGPLLDVGIGSGQFLEFWPHGKLGFDINPEAIKWLSNNGWWADPTKAPIRAASFFDSLEHIREPSSILDQITEWAFASVPILPDGRIPGPWWRHYRPGEHLWYFNRNGFIKFMGAFGFRMVDSSSIETELGRLDIELFAFRRNITPR